MSRSSTTSTTTTSRSWTRPMSSWSTPRYVPIETDDEDDDELDDDDVEASLDVILKERLVVADDDEEDEEEEEPPDAEDRGEGSLRVLPKQPGEFVCRSCFLVKSQTQLADKKRLLCRDCV